jgi:glycosyltransferase involved in cell wall biosynthesis
VRDGKSPSSVVPLGIDLERFDVARRTRPGAVIGNVARLAEQKGQSTLIKAAPLVLRERPEARFVLVGDGELRADLERLADGLPIEFRGRRDDVPALLAEFDVFAFPSLFEGLCLAVIEAHAEGVPVEATPVGGIRETVVDGETGLLVPTQDAPALAAAILRLLGDRDLAERLATEARRRVRERFSLERMVRETLALYAARR